MPKKKKQKPIWKLYLSVSKTNQQYYIGMTSKTGKELEKYFGSNDTVKSWEDPEKVIIHEYEKKSECRLAELICQLAYRFDDRMVNGMFNIRLFRKHVTKVDLEHEQEILSNISAMLEMSELGCGYAIRGRMELLLLVSGKLPN